ncbi:MAG: glycosyltransferase family 4 protein [Candidatus Saccharimonadales bacterium]
MKIGFVLDDGLDKPDGVQQYILTLGAWLTVEGHKVRYLVGQTKRRDIDGLYPIPRNIRVRFNGNALSIPLPASTKKIKAVLADEQFDVLHVQMPYSPFFGAKVIRQADPCTAVVGTFHIMPYGFVSTIGTHLLGLWLRRSLHRFNAFISVSKPAAEFSKRTFGIESKIVPNMVTLAEFRPLKARQSSKKDFQILFLGRLVQRKGCQQLLQALKILHDRGQLPAELSVNICGDGQLREELESYVCQNGLSSVVLFHGFVTHTQKIAFMQSADLAVFPSLAGESFGIVLIEAMAAGSGVVLGGDNPGYRSVLGTIPETIVDAHNPFVLARQLADLIENDKKRLELHKCQQELVQQFDTAVVGGTLLKLYKANSLQAKL